MVDKLADYIIRPSRRTYNVDTDLGPSLFTIDKKYYGSRIDFEVKNRRNKFVKCSLFHHNIYNNESYPLMIYCHGNSGNRTYGYEIVYKMLRNKISVLAFDFAGCGNSEGKYIFLGQFEQYDIDDVLEFALKNFNFIDPARIGVWGRSMGAVSALLFASRHDSLACVVLDSPFKDFSELLREYINRFKIVSLLFGRYLYNRLRKRIIHKAGWDFENLKPINEIKNSTVPAFFFTANKDKIVPKHHSKELYNAYPAEKEFLEAKGTHNSKRGEEVYEKLVGFVKKIFAREPPSKEMWASLGLTVSSYPTGMKPRVKINTYRIPKPQTDSLKTNGTEEDQPLDEENDTIAEGNSYAVSSQPNADIEGAANIAEIEHKFDQVMSDPDDVDIMKTCRELKNLKKMSFSHGGDNTADIAETI